MGDAPERDRLAHRSFLAGGLLAGEPVKRVDYVTVSAGLAVRTAAVPVTSASDHRPVVTDVAVPRGA